MNIRRLALAAALVALTPAAFAATDTDNLVVSINVTNACDVTAAPLAFGDADLSANVDASAVIGVTCSNVGAYSVAFGNGNNFSGGRRMTGASGQFLNYGLFSDAGRTTALTTFGGTSTGGNTADNHTVYGRVPAGQSNKTTGAYGDSVVVTLTY